MCYTQSQVRAKSCRGEKRDEWQTFHDVLAGQRTKKKKKTPRDLWMILGADEGGNSQRSSDIWVFSLPEVNDDHMTVHAAAKSLPETENK